MVGIKKEVLCLPTFLFKRFVELPKNGENFYHIFFNIARPQTYAHLKSTGVDVGQADGQACAELGFQNFGKCTQGLWTGPKVVGPVLQPMGLVPQ
jgi:hypothetical protein